MGRMTYVKALMCLLFPSAALVARAQHPVAGDLKCKLTGRRHSCKYPWLIFVV